MFISQWHTFKMIQFTTLPRSSELHAISFVTNNLRKLAIESAVKSDSQALNVNINNTIYNNRESRFLPRKDDLPHVHNRFAKSIVHF